MKTTLKRSLVRAVLVIFSLSSIALTLEMSLAAIKYIPPKRSAGNRQGQVGASRSTTNSSNKQSLIAMMPTEQGLEASMSSDSVDEYNPTMLSVTQAQPSFAFYVPPQCPVGDVCSLQFDLYTGDSTQVWSKTIEWPGGGSLVQFPMKDSTVSLAEGTEYRWRLLVLDAEGNREYKYSLNGHLSRQQASTALQTALSKAESSRETYLAYSQHGDWLAMMSGVINFYQQNPDNEEVKDDWQSLLPLMEVQCDEISSSPESETKSLKLNCIDLADS